MQKSFYKKVAVIAAPIALQQLVISSLNMVDVFMISSLSNESIAGVGGANKLYFIFNLFLFGMSSGSAILTAQYWGARDYKSIKQVYGITLTFGMAVSLIFGGLAFLAPEWVMHFFSGDAGIISEGAIYLRYVGFSYFFNAISFATVFTLRSMKEVKLPLFVSVVAIGLNTVLNWVLIFGHFGLPAMGVAGAAIATLLSRILEMLILLIACNKRKLAMMGRLSEIFFYPLDLVKKYLVIAGPAIVNEIIWSTGVTMYAVVFGKMGTEVMSAMTIYQTIDQMAFVLIIGLSNSTAIILGNTLGKGDLKKAYQEAIEFLKLGVVIALGLAVLVVLLAEPTVGLFPLTETVHLYVVRSLYVMAVVLLPRTLNTLTVVGILRSGGDTFFTAAVDGLGVWAVGVPLAFLSGLYFKWDIWFVVAAISMDEVVKVTLTLWRTFSKKWLRNLTEASVGNSKCG